MKPPSHLQLLDQCDRTNNTKIISQEANQFLLDLLALTERARDISLTGISEDWHTRAAVRMVCLDLNTLAFDALEILKSTKA